VLNLAAVLPDSDLQVLALQCCSSGVPGLALRAGTQCCEANDMKEPAC